MTTVLDEQIATRERWERDRQVVLAQLHNVMLALRSNTKFSTKRGPGGSTVDHPLTKGVRSLREKLFSPVLQSQFLSADTILSPLVAVIKSEETTEPITGVALAAFVAFLDLKCSFLTPEALRSMSVAAKESKSEVTDTQSHEAVLARILQVYVGCVRHPSASGVDEETTIAMLSSAFGIATLGEPSELLRRTAEQAMNDIVAAVFERVASAGASPKPKILTYVCDLIRCEPSIATLDASRGSAGLGVSRAAIQLQGLCLAHTVLFILKDEIRTPRCVALLDCVRNDLCRALLRVGRGIDNVVVLSQLLRTAHLVVEFASTDVVPQTLTLIKSIHLSPMQRRQLSAVDAPAGSPQTPGRGANASFPLLDEDEVREQHEMLMESLLEFCSDHSFPSYTYYHFDLAPNYPSLLEEICLFLSKNCVHASPGTIPASPQQGVVPSFNQVNMLSLDCLMAMLSSVADRVETHYGTDECRAIAERVQPTIVEKHAKKNRLQQFSEKFEENPKAAVNFLREVPGDATTDCFGIAADSSGWDIGEFLFRFKSAINKTQLGDWIGELGKEPQKPLAEEDPDGLKMQEWEDARYNDFKKVGTVRFFEAQLKGFMNCFRFEGKPLLDCVREMVYNMRLPGEAQKIDRVMEAFAIHWYSVNKDAGPEVNPFQSGDGAFVLSFSMIMLNTDLHSGKLDKTMTLEGFKSMNRGIDNGQNIPEAYLESTYNSVKAQQIIMVDMIQDGAVQDVSWGVEVEEAVEESKDSGMFASMRGSSHTQLASFDEYTFEVLWRPCVTAFSAVLDSCGENCTLGPNMKSIDALGDVYPAESAVLRYALRGFELVAKAASKLQNSKALDHLVVSLIKLIPLTLQDGYKELVKVGRSAKALLACQLLTKIILQYGSGLRDAWNDVTSAINKMHLLGIFCPTLTNTQPAAAEAEKTPVRAPLPPDDLPGSPTGVDSPIDDLLASVPSALLKNPGIVDLSHSRAPSAEKGWLGGWFGGGEGDEQKRLERLGEEQSSLMRVQSACPKLIELLQSSTKFSDDTFQLFVKGMMEDSTMRTDSLADAFTSSYNMHLTVEVAARNVQRLNVIENVLFSHISEQTRHAFNQCTRTTEFAASVPDPERKKRAERTADDWRLISVRFVEAVLRLIGLLSRKTTLHSSMFNLLALITALPPKMFGLIVAPTLSSFLLELIVHPHSTGAPQFSCTDAATWERLLYVVHTICIVAPFIEVRSRGLTILTTIASHGRYDVAMNSQRLSRALLSVALSPPVTASETASDLWTHITQNDVNPVADIATPVVPNVTPKDLDRAVPEALSTIHRRLAASVQQDSQHWVNAWQEVLRALQVLSISSKSSDACIAALRVLQRCVMDPGLLVLENTHFLKVFEEIVFPLVETVCNAVGNRASAGTGQNAFAGNRPTPTTESGSFLSPSVLISSVFGPLAGPERGTAAPASSNPVEQTPVTPQPYAVNLPVNEAAITDEVESQTALLLDKAFLHFFRPLAAAETSSFVALWSRVLGTLYAMYTIHGISKNTSRDPVAFEHTRESIRQHVTNIIMVTTTAEEQPLLRRHPTFWAATRQGLKAFDFADSLLAHLDSLGYTKPQ